jgi:D-alanine--poly(phosphoribitol) ligase subunit 1
MSTFTHQFVNNAIRFSSRNALVLDDRAYSYEQMNRDSNRLAKLLKRHRSPYALLFCSKSYLFFASVLACLKSGKGYTCINQSQTKDQIQSIRSILDATFVIVDKGSGELFREIGFSGIESLVVLDEATIEELWRGEGEDSFAVEVTPKDCAYVFSTSGSTGVPKLVPISHQNLSSYLLSADDRFDVDEKDRFLQNSALTFDVSIHEILFAWYKGACVYGVTTQGFDLIEFVRANEITFWSSVPSVSRKMIQMKKVTPDSMPSLRHTMWIGEPLPASILSTWRVAAPSSTFENMYGPTEATVGITGYDCTDFVAESGTVPIGRPYKNQKIRICDAEGNESSSGELLLGGSQVFDGYLSNPKANEKALVTIEGERWYRSGDLVKRNELGELEFISRIDDQFKVNGYRFERSDVEDRLRRCAKTELVAVLPLPGQDGLVEGTIAFINESPFTALEIRARFRDFMPGYMWPKKIETKVPIGLNLSQKTDYKSLKKIVERM